MRKIAAICLLTAMIAGCGGQSPQRPSTRKGESPKADSTTLALMTMNRQMSRSADEELYRIARTEGGYSLYERGTWAKIIRPGDSNRPVLHGEECTVQMQVTSLNGHLYTDSETTAHAGKYELPPAIDENITEWYHGESLSLIVPWYAAYGIQGTAEIPPYENVRIELTIKE